MRIDFEMSHTEKKNRNAYTHARYTHTILRERKLHN